MLLNVHSHRAQATWIPKKSLFKTPNRHFALPQNGCCEKSIQNLVRGDKHDYTRIYQHLQFSFRSYLLKQLILRRLINRAAERLLSFKFTKHYCDVIMSAVSSQITDVSIVCSSVCSGADQRKHQSSASLAFVMGIYRWPVDSLHKGPVTRKTSPSDDVIMWWMTWCCLLVVLQLNCISRSNTQQISNVFHVTLQ